MKAFPHTASIFLNEAAILTGQRRNSRQYNAICRAKSSLCLRPPDYDVSHAQPLADTLLRPKNFHPEPAAAEEVLEGVCVIVQWQAV